MCCAVPCLALRTRICLRLPRWQSAGTPRDQHAPRAGLGLDPVVVFSLPFTTISACAGSEGGPAICACCVVA
eukprot:9721916-Alexandrium_andersonii.AAC.1